ncbi:MAG: ABC transporter ATP-binding protein, partial [Pseudomonadota bacterium]
AQPSNVLVLDEPTNDLDIETLDLLQELIADYPGTVIVVSHDRDFLDRMATVTLRLEGRGRTALYAGGWSDSLAQGAAASAGDVAGPDGPRKAAPKVGAEKPAERARSSGLTFTESHRLKALPEEIARLEAEIGKLSDLLSDAEIYTTAPAKAEKATAALSERQAKLEAAEEEWLRLAEKAEG